MRKKILVYRTGIEKILSAKRSRPPKKLMKILLKLPQSQFLGMIKTKPCLQAVIPGLPVFLCFAARPVQAEKHRHTRYHSLGTWFCYNINFLHPYIPTHCLASEVEDTKLVPSLCLCVCISSHDVTT